MFRILVADDEGIMLASIKNTIESNFGSECELICVKSGRALIEQARVFHPDIAFVDIQMPGINGIQAIQEIRKFNTSIIFIILTAYDKFTYAQEAVKLGVLEFVTKPVNKQKILAVCMNAMKVVEQARQRLSDDLQIREKLEIVVPMIESGFIYSILQDDGDLQMSQYVEMLNIDKKYAYIIVLEFGDVTEAGVMANAVGTNVRLNKYYATLREVVCGFFAGVIGPIMGNRIVVFVTHANEKTRYDERVEIITRTRTMIKKLEDFIDIKIRSGIGTIKQKEQVRESYKEALKALRESDSQLVHINDIPVRLQYIGDYPYELESEYFKRGRKGDLDGTLICAGEFFDWMTQQEGNIRANIEIKILEIVMRLEYFAFQEGSMDYGYRYRENYLDEIRSSEGISELRLWFMDRTREICHKINISRQEGQDDIIYRAKAYVKEHFANDISLDDVSRAVDISPYYFSKLFKQEVGESFVEYLTGLRIRQAKYLLEDPSNSIKQICVLCGYSDPNYFSRIFKKHTGLTPSEFREK